MTRAKPPAGTGQAATANPAATARPADTTEPVVPPGPAGAAGTAVAAGTAAGVRAALDSGDDLAALTALHAVVEWATCALGRDATRSPAGAFRAVVAVDDALAAAPAFFAALRPLVQDAEPAEEVAADLRRHEEQMAGLARQTASLRKRLAALSQAEDRFNAEIQARDGIAARIAELERTERLAASVAELRAQRDVLEQRAQEVADMVAAADGDIAVAADRLVTLTADLLAALADDTRDKLHRAREQDRLLETRLAERRRTAEQLAQQTGQLREELAAAQEQAAAAQIELEQVQAQAEGRLAALHRYAAADRAVSSALTGQAAGPQEPGSPKEFGTAKVPAGPKEAAGTSGLLAALDQVEERLTGIDGQLKALLKSRERERAPLRPRSGRSAAKQSGAPQAEED